jgi:hypothetical protein
MWWLWLIAGVCIGFNTAVFVMALCRAAAED